MRPEPLLKRREPPQRLSLLACSFRRSEIDLGADDDLLEGIERCLAIRGAIRRRTADRGRACAADDVAVAEGAAIYLSQFQLRHNGLALGGSNVPLRWTDALRGFNNSTPGDGGRRNIVRYDSPTFEGFTAIAAYGVRTTFGTSLWSIRTTSTISASPHA